MTMIITLIPLHTSFLVKPTSVTFTIYTYMYILSYVTLSRIVLHMYVYMYIYINCVYSCKSRSCALVVTCFLLHKLGIMRII